nr:hypothetical protein BaRGS_022040 [Batillaria attramentaria]
MILPQMKKFPGSSKGAGVLGIHLEGPFISREKKGAHPEVYILGFKNGFQDLLDIYGSLDNVAIITVAPELERSEEVIRECVSRGITVSVEAASLHPAQLLGITDQKGTLDFGTDADFILLNDALEVKATYIAGEQVWKQAGFDLRETTRTQQ